LEPIIARLAILNLAVILDWVFGEPPETIHPTVWMGEYILRLKTLILKKRRHRKIWGGCLAISTILVFTVPVYIIERLLIHNMRPLTYILFSSIILKTTFAIKCMHQFNRNLLSALEEGRLEEGRRHLTLLVRRDPWSLDQRHMISASVETIAEGTVDGVISPILYFSLLGLPGAVAYRAINTLDSMIGYKDDIHRDIGLFSAKLDTVANYIPARITALLLVTSALLLGENPRKAFEILLRDHSKTESLNAGWTMATMAGALAIELEKEGNYKLGDGTEEMSIEHISRALKMHMMSILLFLILISTLSIYFKVDIGS